MIPSTGKPIEGVYLAGVIVGGRHANCYMTPMGGMNHGFDVTFGKTRSGIPDGNKAFTDQTDYPLAHDRRGIILLFNKKASGRGACAGMGQTDAA